MNTLLNHSPSFSPLSLSLLSSLTISPSPLFQAKMLSGNIRDNASRFDPNTFNIEAELISVLLKVWIMYMQCYHSLCLADQVILFK